MSQALTSQVSKWCFTLNNYREDFNYKNHLLKAEFKVKRCVYGREVAPTTGMKHLQGYIEFFRSVRLNHSRKIFNTAFWEPAKGNSLQNFRYCSKDGDYTTIGDFKVEIGGQSNDKKDKKVPASSSLIIRGLMDPNCALQVKSSREYAEKSSYYDRITSSILDLQEKKLQFNQWKSKLLFEWQFKVMEKLMNQDERKILWVTDSSGNRGKTFLCSYLSILYRFQYLDGMINCRDLACLLEKSSKGVVFDVSRSSNASFDYGALESLKNGILISGKYRGHSKRFAATMKIAVFSNSFPVVANLSRDRWEIMNLENVPVNGNDPIVCPKHRYPFESLPAMPELNEDFDLRVFLEARVEGDGQSSLDAFASQQSTSSTENFLLQGPLLPQIHSLCNNPPVQTETSGLDDANENGIPQNLIEDAGVSEVIPIMGRPELPKVAEKQICQVMAGCSSSHGTSNKRLLIKDSKGKTTILDSWLCMERKNDRGKLQKINSSQESVWQSISDFPKENEAVSSSDEVIESSQRAFHVRYRNKRRSVTDLNSMKKIRNGTPLDLIEDADEESGLCRYTDEDLLCHQSPRKM